MSVRRIAWKHGAQWVVVIHIGKNVWLPLSYTCARSEEDSIYAYGPEEFEAARRRGDVQCIGCQLGPRGD